jgi:transposase-like protein
MGPISVTWFHVEVGWYLRFSLSQTEMEELLAERGLLVDHVTVWSCSIRDRRHCVAKTKSCWRTWLTVRGIYSAVDR